MAKYTVYLWDQYLKAATNAANATDAAKIDHYEAQADFILDSIWSQYERGRK